MPSISADPKRICQGTGPRWGSVGINGQEDKFFSESWLGALSGGMLDVLVFIESTDPSSEAVLSNYARQVAEIAPSFRGRPFGVEGAALTVNVTAAGAPTVPPHPGYSRIGGEEGFRLRAAVWEETAAAPAVICAHVVVTNLDLQNPLLFTFELGGRAPPASKEMLTVRRIFGPGAVANLTTNDGSRWLPVQAWLAPADTGIFRLAAPYHSQMPAPSPSPRRRCPARAPSSSPAPPRRRSAATARLAAASASRTHP